ncbi:hypothetical protein AB0K05_12965 [Nonomuraea sp. NPDC049486]|uniref:hypothetical protein n=1 Tax=Nonomuraea sp. NPDC049486 TaxID=3155773 RepID=UPI003438FDA4
MARYRTEVGERYDRDALHPWSVTRRVLAAETAPCERPVLVQANGHRRLIACGRRLPHDQQCRACRPAVTITQTRRLQG